MLKAMRYLLVLLMVLMIQGLAACSTGSSSGPDRGTVAKNTETAGKASDDQKSDGTDHYTKYADYTPEKAVPVEVSKGENNRILVAYFSRSGNTATGSSTDAVSSASLKIGDDGATKGNSQQIAQWLAEETGGDLFLIQTEYTYPLDYDKAVAVGEGQDRDGYHPVLVSTVKDMDQYDTIYLVYPVWHYTLPVPVCSFLDGYDLSGKKVVAFTANAGSRFADTLERIREAEPGAEITEGVSLNEEEIKDGKEQILEFLKKHPPEGGKTEDRQSETQEEQTDRRTAEADGDQEESELILTVGGKQVQVDWEDNPSVRELKELVRKGPLTIEMSMYGGFEQVGPLGTTLTSNDAEMTTSAGDIVLYSSDQIVIFYGSNSWSYTRLGHITNQSTSGMVDLLGNGDVAITLGIR